MRARDPRTSRSERRRSAPTGAGCRASISAYDVAAVDERAVAAERRVVDDRRHEPVAVARPRSGSARVDGSGGSTRWPSPSAQCPSRRVLEPVDDPEATGRRTRGRAPPAGPAGVGCPRSCGGQPLRRDRREQPPAREADQEGERRQRASSSATARAATVERSDVRRRRAEHERGRADSAQRRHATTSTGARIRRVEPRRAAEALREPHGHREERDQVSASRSGPDDVVDRPPAPSRRP